MIETNHTYAFDLDTGETIQATVTNMWMTAAGIVISVELDSGRWLNFSRVITWREIA